MIGWKFRRLAPLEQYWINLSLFAGTLTVWRSNNLRALERGIRRSEVRYLMGYSEFFLCPELVTRWKINHLFLFLYRAQKLTISLTSIYKHYTIDIADPSSTQDASHMNFVTDLAHRGVSVTSWYSIGARNPKVWGSIPHGLLRIFFFVPRMWQDKNKHLSQLTQCYRSSWTPCVQMSSSSLRQYLQSSLPIRSSYVSVNKSKILSP